MPASRARLPVLCVTLVTLDSCCLGFPTCWAEIGLLAESARVLTRQGLAGAWAAGKVVYHGFLKGRRGRQPVPARRPHSFSYQLCRLRLKCGCFKGTHLRGSQEGSWL